MRTTISEKILLSIMAFGLTFVVLVVPVAVYLDYNDFKDRGCEYTGVEKKERKMEYNVALKMLTSRNVTQREYVCEVGQGGWK